MKTGPVHSVLDQNLTASTGARDHGSAMYQIAIITAALLLVVSAAFL